MEWTDLGISKGLTFLEVLMALLVLSIGLLAMVSLFGAGHRVLGMSEQKSLAGQLARNKMEGLRVQRPIPIPAEKEDLAGVGITRTWSIVQSEKDPRLWVITVSVFPTNAPERSVVLKSLLFY